MSNEQLAQLINGLTDKISALEEKVEKQQSLPPTPPPKPEGFDRAKYDEIAKNLDCKTKNGKAVWKAARPLVKAIMDEETINGVKITEDLGKVFVELIRRSF